MAVDLSWSDPTAAQGSGGLALVTGDTLTQTSWQKTVSNLYVLAGGNQGCGQLQYVSTTQVRFRPTNGAWVRIAGLLYNLTTDVTATNTSASIDGTTGQTLAINTVYYVYLYLVGSTVTIDFSTTAYAISSTAGNVGTYIKSGANTRTLVGMVRTNASSQFTDSVTQRFVRSWFNRKSIIAYRAMPTDRTTTSSSYAEMSSADRVEFLIWTDEAALCGYTGSASSSGSAGDNYHAGLGLNGTTLASNYIENRNMIAGNAYQNNISMAGPFTATEGYNYITLIGKVQAGNTLTVIAAGGGGGITWLKLGT